MSEENFQPLDNSSEQKRWPGMPGKYLNMDWEELLDEIQSIRSSLEGVKDSSDARYFAKEMGEKLGVTGVMCP